jgi:hypothetical protein
LKENAQGSPINEPISLIISQSKISRHFMVPEVLLARPPLILILSQMNPVSIFLSGFFKIYSILSSDLRIVLPIALFLLGFPT